MWRYNGKFGKNVGKITGLIKSKQFKVLEDGYELDVDGELVKLELEDVVIRYSAKGKEKIESDRDIIARLDTVLTDKLKDEGLAREIVRYVQDARKNLNCEISDRIMLQLDGELSENSKEYICSETLADLVEIVDEDFRCDVIANEKVVEVKVKVGK